jgi:hypothetical protein
LFIFSRAADGARKNGLFLSLPMPFFSIFSEAAGWKLWKKGCDFARILMRAKS